jgi:hypothetical protein
MTNSFKDIRNSKTQIIMGGTPAEAVRCRCSTCSRALNSITLMSLWSSTHNVHGGTCHRIMQQAHSIVAMRFIAVVLAHIYIGTIGMEGAFEAMGSGTVDLNWAKEHHSLPTIVTGR